MGSLGGTPFSNSASGQIQLTAGNLQFDGSGVWQGGAFSVAAGSAAYFNGTSATFSGALTGSGAGKVRLGSGTMNIDTGGLAAQKDNPRVLALNVAGQWVVARDPIHPQVGRIAGGVGPGIPAVL